VFVQAWFLSGFHFAEGLSAWRACTIISANSEEIIVCLPRRFGKSYWGVCLCEACRVEASCEAWSVANKNERSVFKSVCDEKKQQVINDKSI